MSEVFRPKLKEVPKPVLIKGRRDYRVRAHGVKKNIGRFFSCLSQHLYGGKTHEGVWEAIEITENKRYSRCFCPDIIDKKEGGILTTEVKSMSRKRSRPLCPLKQLENACSSLLGRLEEGQEMPSHEYHVYGYGKRRDGVSFLKSTKGKMVSTLAQMPKKLVTFPLPLALLLYSRSRHEVMNHTKSNFGRDSELYWGFLLSSFDLAFEGQDFLGFLRESPNGQQHFKNIEVEDCFLDRMSVEQSMVPTRKVSYCGRDTEMPGFPVARINLSLEDRAEWLRHFYSEHKRILDDLLLTDLFQQRSEYLERTEKKEEPEDEVPF